MGSTYAGPPFADEIGHTKHEGSTLAVAAGPEQGQDQIMAVCACGWRGATTHGNDEHGIGLAHHEWDHDHIRAALREAALREIAVRRVAVGADALVDLVHRMREQAHDQGHAADMLAALLDALPKKTTRGLKRPVDQEEGSG